MVTTPKVVAAYPPAQVSVEDVILFHLQTGVDEATEGFWGDQGTR